MKKILLLACMALACGASQAQSVVHMSASGKADSICIDTTKYRITYDMKHVADTTVATPRHRQDVVRLDVGRAGVTHFYSYGDLLRKKLMTEQLQTTGTIDMRVLPKTGALEFAYLTNYPTEGESSYQQNILLGSYEIVEAIETPQWEVVADSTKQILGYECQMAQTSFHGRQWSVYYTEDIPLSYGPWKLAGLPGLVLEAHDAKNHYIFTATGMEELATPEAMKMYKKKAEKVTWKELRKIDTTADTATLLQGGVVVKVASADGKPMKALPKRKPTNMIELE